MRIIEFKTIIFYNKPIFYFSFTAEHNIVNILETPLYSSLNAIHKYKYREGGIYIYISLFLNH